MSRLLLCDVRGPVEDLLEKLSGEEGEEWLGALKKMLRKQNPWDEKKSSLLARVCSVSVPDIPNFVMDEVSQKKANIGWLGINFLYDFFGKTEEGVAQAQLALHRLKKNSLDKPILARLGDKAEISLAQFIGLIEKQAKGREGVLLVNGYANIAYIGDKNGVIWAVSARWYSGRGYWEVFTFSCGNPHGWHTGNQIVSRDS